MLTAPGAIKPQYESSQPWPPWPKISLPPNSGICCEDDVGRDQQHLARDHDRPKKDQEHRVAAGELPLGEGIGRQRVEEHLQEGHGDRDIDAVEQPQAQVLGLQEFGVVFEARVAWDPARRPAEHIADILQRGGDHPGKRGHKQHRAREQQDVDDQLPGGIFQNLECCGAAALCCVPAVPHSA